MQQIQQKQSNDESVLLSNKYQQKTDKEHILSNPDTYIGSVEQIDSELWILNDSSDKIIEKNINYIPGLFKLFDEGIVNCRDHVIRMAQAVQNQVPNSIPVSCIDISIQNDGTICMMNDGNGIDVAEHPEYKIWIPELIFGHLRTSTNYDKNEKKIVGGKNGFGFKLVLIWSVFGSIETYDHVRGLKYYQEFKNNLDVIEKPKITKVSNKKPYTKITFKPDYARLGIQGLSPDMVALLKKRVYDIAAITVKSLKVKYNSQLVPIKNFQQYIDLYIQKTESSSIVESENNDSINNSINNSTDISKKVEKVEKIEKVYEEGDSRWEYAVALSPTHEFIQVSFVNGINTSKGGKHVEYILNQITRKLISYIEKKKKVVVNANSIKEQIILFLRCDIENPAFDSQTKDYMNTPSSKFGSTCNVSDKFIEKIAKMGIMDSACALTEIKENKSAKKTDGSKTKNIRGIPKLMDANWAGTDKSAQCIAILCEGDSAKAGIASGLSSEDRNTIGVYPMKGKIMNVRGEVTKKIAENKEIAEIKKILGLETGKEYKSMEDVSKHLRYGKVVIMCDADLDGSHIKGLIANLFHSEWASLAAIPGFIGFMNTPILKAKKGNQEMVFYNEGEYKTWKNIHGNEKGWNIKYYKGLGTSTGKEFREYFQNKKLIGFSHNGEKSNDIIDMVFNKKRADDRKDWLKEYNRENYLDTSKQLIPYEEFVDRELIHFSKYDCDRSIPNLMDGLKISLRKILYSAFKRNLVSEIKVAQFSGYVSEHSGYHHGEASLNGAIVCMAQNYVGSNNINLLEPKGQYGGRLAGGKDHASERYIFTHLCKITRFIYPQQDDAILKYLDDDGMLVEPVYYAPIIPMVLVNGSKGIGTGFSTEILCYNPVDIISYLKNKLQNNIDNIETDIPDFVPYYEGFNGTIQKIADKKYLVKGKYTKIGPDKIHITELPVGTWNDDFKEYLESLTDGNTDKTGKKIAPIVKDYDDMSKDTNVDFIITLQKGKLEELEKQNLENGCNGLEKTFKLYSTLSSTNMHLFDADEKLKKYDSVCSIIEDYFETRLQLYQVRKDYLIKVLSKELNILSNKSRYIQEILNEVIDLRKKKREEVFQMLQSRSYDILDEDEEYKYLVKMSMDAVTEENVEKMNKEHENKQEELSNVINTTIQQMWLQELVLLEKEYYKYKEEREKTTSGSTLVKTAAKQSKRK